MTSARLASRLNSSHRRGDPGSRRWIRVAMAVLATVGAIDTGAITLRKWEILANLSCAKEGFFGCNGCEKVLASAWGTVLGQPLALFGFLAYGAVLLLALVPLLPQVEGMGEIRQRSWWGLLMVSTGMAVFSAVLVGVMVWGIRDCCPFCILSAVLSVSLLALSLVGGDWPDRGNVLFRLVLVGLAVAIFGLGWASSVNRPAAPLGQGMPIPVTSPSTPATLALADHLKAVGAVMYTAYWCPHCHEQKELFGKEATERLTIVECAPDGHNSQKALCDAKKIGGYPTWEINGRLDSGVKSLAKLAQLSGYQGAVPGPAPAAAVP